MSSHTEKDLWFLSHHNTLCATSKTSVHSSHFEEYTHVKMRLLRRKSDGDFELVPFSTDDLPPYAILSHTWTDGEEVTYDELVAGAGKGKAGYAKIRFCGERAAQDGIQYFWVDTCCTIQTHHRRQRPTKRVAYAAENGGRTYIAFQYKRINISLPSAFSSENP
jgi:hypothetical protein